MDASHWPLAFRTFLFLLTKPTGSCFFSFWSGSGPHTTQDGRRMSTAAADRNRRRCGWRARATCKWRATSISAIRRGWGNERSGAASKGFQSFALRLLSTHVRRTDGARRPTSSLFFLLRGEMDGHNAGVPHPFVVQLQEARHLPIWATKGRTGTWGGLARPPTMSRADVGGGQACQTPTMELSPEARNAYYVASVPVSLKPVHHRIE